VPDTSRTAFALPEAMQPIPSQPLSNERNPARAGAKRGYIEKEAVLDGASDRLRAALDHAEHGLGAYGASYLRQAAQHLSGTLARAEQAGLSGAVDLSGHIFATFAERLAFFARPTAALLLNVARVKGALRAELPADRLVEFGQQLLDPQFRKDCGARYPVLDAILAAVTEDAIGAWDEFFGRLASDLHELRALAPNGLGKLKETVFYAGDPHNRGRSVVIVTGELGRVVYKPRSLDTDAAFARVIDWLNPYLNTKIAHPAVIRKERYGWMEFVAEKDCANESEVEECFHRCGTLLGLFYALGGSDLHHENIICAGPNPRIVDAEALLNGQPASPNAAVRRLQRVRLDSAISTSYLPHLQKIHDGAIDVSGVGYTANQQMVLNGAVPANAADDMHARDLEYITAVSGNVPKLAGQPQHARHYLHCLEAGFEQVLRALIEHREELLTREGLIPSFKNVRSRFIARATAYYGSIAGNARHPHACVSNARQEEALAQLGGQHPWTKRVAAAILKADLEAMRRGDIPFFTALADSKSVWTADGREIPGVFEESGWQLTVDRIRTLSPATLARELRSIRFTFSVSEGKVGRAVKRRAPQARTVASSDLRLKTAVEIGDHLLERALVSRGDIHWLSRAPMSGRFTPVFTASDLYGGSAGIGLYYAQLARATGAPRFKRSAELCLANLRRVQNPRNVRVGAFDGLSGLIYADALISRSLEIDADRDFERLFNLLAEAVSGDRIFDVIGGAAGALLVATSLRTLPQIGGSADALAHAAARHLLGNAVETASGIAWKSEAFDRPLTGMAHGSCGIALALTQYAATFADQEALEAAAKALRHARASFDKRRKLWRDLRDTGGHMIAWCHGTGGITLARQRAIELVPQLGDAATLEEIDTGLKALSRPVRDGMDTLCHGRSGNWEPLWKGTTAHRQVAATEEAGLCSDWNKRIMPGTDLDDPPPELMNGLAGVGYQILRSLDPTVPCVAVLGV